MSVLHLPMDPNKLETFNFDNLTNGPADIDKIKNILEYQSIRKNIISLDEFNREYKSLFQSNTSLNGNEYSEMSVKYMGRIDPYNPVYVVYSMAGEYIDEVLRKENIAYALPPIYNRVNTINNYGKQGTDLLQAFNNVSIGAIDDRFDIKKSEYSKGIAIILDKLNNEQDISELAKNTYDMTKSIVGNKLESNNDVAVLSKEELDDIANIKSMSSVGTNAGSLFDEKEEYL